MALDAYSPCPCGSGKKFKWCCQPIHVQIDKAFRQNAEGQHDAALRAMDEVTREHPGNPEAWGRKAQLLYQNGKVEEAEEALQKAFDINPNYAFGYLLRGTFRQAEGEIVGAVLLFRKAAELYDPEARDILGQVYAMIGDCELKLNRPVAGRAAFKIAMHCVPGDGELPKIFDDVFGDKSLLPASARREYVFQSPSAEAAGARREAWSRAVAAQGPIAGAGWSQGTKLHEAARAFGQLTTEDPQDAAAWYNLGLVQAWLGENRAALAALDRYVELESDEGRATAAWTLAEVLRCGYGMNDEANYREHSVLSQIRNPEPVFAMLQDWSRERRLLVLQNNQEQGMLTGLVLERLPELTGALASTQTPGLGAYLLVIGGHLRLWNTKAEALSKLLDEVRQRSAGGLTETQRDERPANFNEILSEAIAFPVHATDPAEANRRVEAHMERFFEETWIHRPLRSLNLIPPIDAAGHGTLRKKVAAAVQFLQDCAATKQGPMYDFERLRHKLGLAARQAATAPAGGAAPAGDIGVLGAAELAALKLEDLADEQLEQAYQSALKLDARELAGRFAQALVGRPARPGRPDRFPWYAHLIQHALTEGNTAAALDFVNEGEKADCEQNEGRRRNDYELRRAQIHAKRGEADEAQGVFERLIERIPSELRYRGAAAEAMLSARQGGRALKFAEQGLAKAREQNNRESEDYFKELLAAAQKQAKG